MTINFQNTTEKPRETLPEDLEASDDDEDIPQTNDETSFEMTT